MAYKTKRQQHAERLAQLEADRDTLRAALYALGELARFIADTKPRADRMTSGLKEYARHLDTALEQIREENQRISKETFWNRPPARGGGGGN